MTITPEFTEKVRAILEEYPKSHSVNSLRNSLVLLSKAKEFVEIDGNIAAFLSITAEEEAVSSIFLCLKQLGYDGADKINHWNHIHKAAFFPFCQALTHTFELFNKNRPQLAIDRTHENPRLFIRFFVEDSDGKSFVAKSDVPFGFAIRNENGIDYFDKNLKIFFGKHFSKLKKWLVNAANKRNRVLYATPSGIPNVQFSDTEKFFAEYERKINTMMLLYFLIAPYKEKQIFIQQALHAFVKMLGKIPQEDKLLEIINDKDQEPVSLNIDLNTGKIKGFEIQSSAIEHIEFKENEVTVKIG